MTLEGYRSIYRAYLRDPDIQDARARWPFVAIWDNHEFSWQGWQSMLKGGSVERPAQTLKVAANQAWFEYQPARITKPSGPASTASIRPTVADAPLTDLDENGLSQEPNNLAAINSLTVYRTLRYGAHLDLMITDQYSYKMLHPFNLPEGEGLGSPPRPLSSFYPEEVGQILDAGRTYNGGNPPDTITVGETTHAQLPEGQSALHHPRRSARKAGSWTSSGNRARPGKSGAIRSACSKTGPIRKTCRKG